MFQKKATNLKELKNNEYKEITQVNLQQSAVDCIVNRIAYLNGYALQKMTLLRVKYGYY